MNKRKKIFVSYTTMSREINLESLTEIKKLLEKYCEPYIELLDESSLKTQNSIIRELSNSNLLLLLKTKHVENSKWVQLELEYASNHNIPILQVEPELILVKEEEYLIMNKILSMI